MKKKLFLKYVIGVALILALIYFLRKSSGTVKDTWSVFKTGDELWVWAAISLEIVATYFLLMMHKLSFMAAAVKRTTNEMATLILSANVLNVLAPAADTASYLLFIRDAKSKNEPATNILSGVMLATIVDFSTFAFILVFADIYLYLFGELTAYQIVASFLFMGLTVIFGGLLYLGIKQQQLLKKILTIFSNVIYRIKKFFTKKAKEEPVWVKLVDSELAAAATAVIGNVNLVVKAALYSFLFHAANIIVLACVFHAFDQKIKIGVLVAGYAVGFVFKIVAPVPQGIGVVEGVMSVAYVSLGIPFANALAAVLLFRGIVLWLPLLVGFVTLQRYNLKNDIAPI